VWASIFLTPVRAPLLACGRLPSALALGPCACFMRDEQLWRPAAKVPTAWLPLAQMPNTRQILQGSSC
jgi:hypothetical protein